MKKAQQKIDKILAVACKRTQDEVSGLIGASFTLSPPHSQLIYKEEVFEQLAGKYVLAKVDVSGDIQGLGCLLLELKDAIRLGGTLIMLPDDALEEMVSAGDYNEDAEDSYGEIANIVAGSYTKVFEEMYPQNCRFVRKTQEVIIPLKVDIGSDEPVPDQLYYQVSSAMMLGEQQMGSLVMLLPAATFDLEEDAAAVEAVSSDAPPQQESNIGEEGAGGVQEEPSPVAESHSVNEVAPGFDVKKHQKRVDTLLEMCRQKLGEEMGALLGVEVTLSDQECRPVTKEDYFLDEASGKQILAHMNVVGEIEDKSYLFVALKDAIFIGGTLIMLPPVELERAITDDEFNEDTEDAYGEIANIMSGVFTSVFEEQYIKKVRFVKTGLEQVLPLKVDTESETPLPNQLYYMSSSSLNIAGKPMGKVQMLFPAAMLQLDRLLQQEAPRGDQEAEQGKAGSVSRQSSEQGTTASSVGGTKNKTVYQGIDILIVSDDAQEAEKITEVLEQRHLSAKVLSFKESVTDYLPGEVKAVFLVMSNVNEKAFSVAIKISAACSLPLIAAGPGWTRTKVITAVKYGVNDILLTPATSDDVGEKIENIPVKLAA